MSSSRLPHDRNLPFTRLSNLVIIKAPQRQEPPTSKLGEKDELKSSLAAMAVDTASKDQELTEIRSQLAAREEETAAAAAMAETLGKAREALSQVVQEKEALETRLKEV